MPEPLAVQSAREPLVALGVVPLDRPQPTPRLIVDAPVPDRLSFGRVVIQYRVLNLRITPTFEPNAFDVSPASATFTSRSTICQDTGPTPAASR